MDHFSLREGDTPLDPDEAADLIPSHVTTQGQLNALETLAIQAARRWALSPRQRADRRRRLWDDALLRDVHRRMFGEVWTWAGRYRQTAKTIGISAAAIAVQVRELLENARLWRPNGMDPLEADARFHHRLVQIHPFSNGNGRHARLYVDLIRAVHGDAPLAWGRRPSVSVEAVRGEYLAALRAADRQDFGPLKAFLE